jgi:hypothetical protein
MQYVTTGRVEMYVCCAATRHALDRNLELGFVRYYAMMASCAVRAFALAAIFYAVLLGTERANWFSDSNRHSAEISWKMENARGNLTRVEADHLE